MKLTDPPKEQRWALPEQPTRFWSKVSAVESGCWEWQASTFKTGYGAFSVGRRMKYAHRLSYRMFFGEPGELFVCHHCDNRKCVNPAHLFLGTPKDNTDDMRRKGREENPPVHVGESHPRAIITAEDVREIRRLSAEGLSAPKIAARFGLKSSTTIYNIRCGLQWGSIQ